MAETNTRLVLLKKDLQQTTTVNDDYLNFLLQTAEKRITEEGIVLTAGDVESESLIIQYASYLFRKRAGTDTSMPRFLRYSLNNMLMHQKGSTT